MYRTYILFLSNLKTWVRFIIIIIIIIFFLIDTSYIMKKF